MGRKIKQGRENQGLRIKARPESTPNPESEPPVFSLRYLAPDYCVSRCQVEQKAAFAEALWKRSRLTWAQLRQAPRHGLGYEKIARDAFNVAIPPHITDEVNLIAFRFNGQAPMVGYRDQAVFYIVWLDRDFTVYDHG